MVETTKEYALARCKACGERRVPDQPCPRCKAQQLVEAFADLPSLKPLIAELKKSLATYVDRVELRRRDTEHRREVGRLNKEVEVLRNVAEAAKAVAFGARVDEKCFRTRHLFERLTKTLNLLSPPPEPQAEPEVTAPLASTDGGSDG